VNISGISGAALSAFDPITFFMDKMPVNGTFQITLTHKGATYYFKNKGHKKLFEPNPDKYTPQTGGFCTLGVSVITVFPVDISTWKVFKGKLYLNFNPGILL
jgi:YHS domain-containing protein